MPMYLQIEKQVGRHADVHSDQFAEVAKLTDEDDEAEEKLECPKIQEMQSQIADAGRMMTFNFTQTSFLTVLYFEMEMIHRIPR